MIIMKYYDDPLQLIRKMIPREAQNFNGGDIVETSLPPCEYCDCPIHVCGRSNNGQYNLVTCDTYNCKGNIDTKRKAMTMQEIMTDGNVNRCSTIPFVVRRIV